MNPWLQRFLLGWAAGVVATGAIVSTAKRPHRLKRKRRKKKEDGTDEPIQIGALALTDARLPDERALTVSEWRDRVVATGASVGTRVSSLFTGSPPANAREPDEVQRVDGTVGHAAKRKSAPGRRGRKRQQATLWDSARESLKQSVKETVAHEVQQSPMGSALETLRDVGAKVKSGATTAAASAATFVQRGIEGNPEPADDGKPPGTQSAVGESPTFMRAADASPGGKPPREQADQPQAQKPAAPRSAGGVDAAAEVAAEVAAKVNAGIAAVGSWLQGPGAPGYQKRRRAEGTGAVVDAKDAPSVAPSSPTFHVGHTGAQPQDDDVNARADDDEAAQ